MHLVVAFSALEYGDIVSQEVSRAGTRATFEGACAVLKDTRRVEQYFGDDRERYISCENLKFAYLVLHSLFLVALDGSRANAPSRDARALSKFVDPLSTVVCLTRAIATMVAVSPNLMTSLFASCVEVAVTSARAERSTSECFVVVERGLRSMTFAIMFLIAPSPGSRVSRLT